MALGVFGGKMLSCSESNYQAMNDVLAVNLAVVFRQGYQVIPLPQASVPRLDLYCSPR